MTTGEITSQLVAAWKPCNSVSGRFWRFLEKLLKLDQKRAKNMMCSLTTHWYQTLMTVHICL